MYNSYLKNLDKRFKIINYINILDNDILATIISMKLIFIHNADGTFNSKINTVLKGQILKLEKKNFPLLLIIEMDNR